GGPRELRTADSEPDALRERWAWGFGHLRRSSATLFALTGNLDKRMVVMRPTWAHELYEIQSHVSGDDERIFRPSDDRGRCAQKQDPTEPAWLSHCAQGGRADSEASSRCIILSPRANLLQSESAGR